MAILTKAQLESYKNVGDLRLCERDLLETIDALVEALKHREMVHTTPSGACQRCIDCGTVLRTVKG
jgi:hypothetical protein